MRTISNTVQHFCLRWAIPCVLTLLWLWATASGQVNLFLVPPPTVVIDAAFELAGGGALGAHLRVSAGRAVGGFALTVALALPLALFLAVSPIAYRSLSLLLDFFRVVPPLAMVPLFILWLGIGEGAKLAIVVLSSFFPVFLNAYAGFAATDRRFVELAESLELTPGQRFRHVLLPAALPHVISGLRVGFAYSWRALVGAELIAASAGLGFLIGEAAEMARTDRVFVGIACIAGLGIASDQLFLRLAGSLAPWARETGPKGKQGVPLG